MIISIIGGTLTFLIALSVFYIAYKMKKPKHWSQGYLMLGDRDYSSKRREQKQENSGMFPPGW